MNELPETTILAIETSCDETGVAIVRGQGDTVQILAHAVASQVDIHAATGGVVPEVAAREHVAVIIPLIQQVMSKAAVQQEDITAIAVTVGPGLQPALSVGVQAARTLAFAWKKPIVPVHHLEGHIYSALLGKNTSLAGQQWPALGLIVSGGHTMLVRVAKPLQYNIIGNTKDDAAGEAFDKVARLLGLGYPGGAVLSALATEGNPKAFTLPRPMIQSTDLDFSFSGLKTAVLYLWRELGVKNEQVSQKANVAASFQAAVVETLVAKTTQAIAKEKPGVLFVAGGVAANQLLREQLAILAEKNGIQLVTAPAELCGDNAAMIGQAGMYALQVGRTVEWSEIEATARVSLESFSVV